MISPSGRFFRAQSSPILNDSSDGVSSLLLGYHLTVRNSLQSKAAVVPPHSSFFAFFPAFCFVFSPNPSLNYLNLILSDYSLREND